MIEVQFNLTINRPAMEIWNFMFDLKNVPKWDPGVAEARLINEGPLERIGARIQTLGQGNVDRGTVEVEEYEIGRKVVLEFVKSQKSRFRRAKLTYTFEQKGEQTILTRLVEVELSGLSKLLQPLVTSRIQKDSDQEAAMIKTLFSAGS
jgi:hypothetical protein